MFSLKRPLAVNTTIPLLNSQLYSDQTFYPALMHDLLRARRSVVIESPFITHRRLSKLLPILQRLVTSGVSVTVNTRHPSIQDEAMMQQSLESIKTLQNSGVTVLYTGSHHRKLAIIDSYILYEGSLNILSQSDSCEIMRRIESEELVSQMIRFIGLDRWYS